MQITSGSYLPRLPATANRPGDQDVRAESATPKAPVAPTLPVRATRPADQPLPDDMQQARLRGRPMDGEGSYAGRRAVAQYADVAQSDTSASAVEVLRIDAYV